MSPVTAVNLLPVRNPRTGQSDRQIHPLSSLEIASVCTRLRTAQKAWGAAPLEHRMAVMRAWAEKLKAYRPQLVEADSIDTGGGQISRVAPDMIIGSIMRHCSPRWCSPRQSDRAYLRAPRTYPSTRF
jgi:acyl-CoA reductase-like NAD-dependent aldehyde dehydrogenase